MWRRGGGTWGIPSELMDGDGADWLAHENIENLLGGGGLILHPVKPLFLLLTCMRTLVKSIDSRSNVE